jgi:hypothetical protein
MKFYKQFSRYMEEASIEQLAQRDSREMYTDEEVKDMDAQADLAPEAEPNEAFKALEDVLNKFYTIGQKGLGADAAAVHDRVYNILVQHEVDQKDMQRFADVLTSILLGQSMRGFADSRD